MEPVNVHLRQDASRNLFLYSRQRAWSVQWLTRSDRVKAVIVVPTAYKAGYWMALRNHAIEQFELTQTNAEFANAQALLGRHTVCLVDFGGPDPTTPPCGREDRARGCRPLLEPIESEGRALVQEELLRLADSAIVASQSEVAQTGA